MHTVTLLALLVAMVASVAMAADKTVQLDQISLVIKEKSGAMTLTATEMEREDDDDEAESGEDDDDDDAAAATTAEPESEDATTTTKAPERKRRAADDLKTNNVEVMFVSLKEVDANGIVVGEKKDKSQALDSFGEVTFTFDTLNENSKIPYSANSKDEEISAVEQSYSANLEDSGMVKVVVYIAKEDGNLTLGADNAKEKTEVKKYQIKFSVHIEGWKWCTAADANCKKEGDDATNEVGAALDMVINVKGHGDPTTMDAEDGMAMHISIGNDNHLFVSKKVMKTATDDSTEWVDMATDYPKSEKDGEDTTKLMLRFPSFQKSMLYDPSIRLMIPGSQETSTASSTVAASLGVVLVALVAAVLRM